MNRPCQSCGLFSCDGIECYLADPADFDGDAEMEAWLAQVAAEEAEMAARVNNSLEPKRRAA